MADPDGKFTSPAGLTGIGSVTISGVAVFMLVNVQAAMVDLDKTVTQHGQELNLIRQSINEGAGMQRHEIKDLQIDMLRMQKDVQRVLVDHEDLKRLATDKTARPDAWGRSDDDARMKEHTEYMQAWTKDLCRSQGVGD